MTKSLWIVIPAYNEEKNIGQVIRDWYPIVEKAGGESYLLLVNDGSSDKTQEVGENLMKELPRLLVEKKENGGHGAAILFGYRYALSHGADYVFQTDSDGQTLAKEFAPLWEDREKAGLLVGARHHRQDGLGRLFVTKVLKVLVGLTFHTWLEDSNSPFRLMGGEELAEILPLIPQDYHLANVLVSVLFKKKGSYVAYYPITFRQRQAGKNSINIPRIFAMGRRACGEFLLLGRKFRKLGGD